MIENISLAFQGIWGHKLRSFLTMLGIIIGIAAIMTIVSTIQGTNEQIKQNLIGSGTDAVKIELYQGDMQLEFMYNPVPDGIPTITQEVKKEILELEEVANASLYNSRRYSDNIFYQNTAYSGMLLGIDEDYFDVYNYYIQYGRDFEENDFKNYKKVAILDSIASKSLFESEIPIGKTIEINNEPYIVGFTMQTMFQKGMLEMSHELMSWLSLLCKPTIHRNHFPFGSLPRGNLREHDKSVIPGERGTVLP